MVTVNLNVLDDTANEVALPLTLGFVSVPSTTPAGHQTQWAVRAVGMDGTDYGELVTAVVTRVLWLLDAPEEADFDVSLDDPVLGELPLAGASVTPHREVQIWRNGHLLLWLVPTTRRVDRTRRVVSYSAKGLLWYFTRRYMGRASRHNFLTNGDFEAALAPRWTKVDPTGTLTTTQATDRFLDGSHSLKMVGGGAAAADRYEHQRITVTSQADGLALFFSAWVWVGTLNGTAINSRGLTISRSGVPGAIGSWVLDANTPQGSWVRAEAFINMPPSVTETIDCRLYGIDGTLWWDVAQVTVEESDSFVNGADEGGICSQVILTAQGRGPLAIVAGEPLGKSDLHIGTRFPVTGVRKAPVYQFADHQKIYDGGKGFGILDGFMAAADGLDIAIEVTPTTRTAVGYFPERGIDRTADFTLVYRYFPDDPERSGSFGIVDYSFGESIENTANQITELGGWSTIVQDHGASREEAGYSNPAALGGLTLELVETVAQGTAVGQLQEVADQRGARLQGSVVTPTITVVEPRDATDAVTRPLIGVVLPGDTIAIDLVDGGLVYRGNARLASVQLDPATERLTLVPNL